MKRGLLLLALALSVVGSLATPAVGADLDDHLTKVKERITVLRYQISTSSGDRSGLARKLLEVGEMLDAAEREVAEASADLEEVSVLLDERMDALAAVRTELAIQFDELVETRALRDGAHRDAESWAVRAYMEGGAAQPSIAFNASALNKVTVGVTYLDVLTQHSSTAADRYEGLVATEEIQEAGIRAVEQQVSIEVGELQSMGLNVGMLQNDLHERRGALALAYGDQEELIVEIDAEIAEFEGELASLAKEEKSIRAQIVAASSPKVSSSGRFVRPVPGAISSGFGMRVHPITGNTRMHNGADMNGAMGDPIRAASGGTVILAGVKGGYGNTVMIDHGGGIVTLYAHQSRMAVSSGQRVSAGQVIGYVGSTGDSTGPHLHFEVRVNSVPTNPTKYI